MVKNDSEDVQKEIIVFIEKLFQMYREMLRGKKEEKSMFLNRCVMKGPQYVARKISDNAYQNYKLTEVSLL